MFVNVESSQSTAFDPGNSPEQASKDCLKEHADIHAHGASHGLSVLVDERGGMAHVCRQDDLHEGTAWTNHKGH